jgi:hypothetical protein
MGIGHDVEVRGSSALGEKSGEARRCFRLHARAAGHSRGRSGCTFDLHPSSLDDFGRSAASLKLLRTEKVKEARDSPPLAFRHLYPTQESADRCDLVGIERAPQIFATEFPDRGNLCDLLDLSWPQLV